MNPGGRAWHLGDAVQGAKKNEESRDVEGWARRSLRDTQETP